MITQLPRKSIFMHKCRNAYECNIGVPCFSTSGRIFPPYFVDSATLRILRKEFVGITLRNSIFEVILVCFPLRKDFVGETLRNSIFEVILVHFLLRKDFVGKTLRNPVFETPTVCCILRKKLSLIFA